MNRDDPNTSRTSDFDEQSSEQPLQKALDNLEIFEQYLQDYDLTASKIGTKTRAITTASVNSLRGVFTAQYFKHGRWKTISNVTAGFGAFIGVAMILGLGLAVLWLPFAVMLGTAIEPASQVGMVLGAVFVGAAFLKAREDVKARKQTQEICQRPNPTSAKRAYDYLDAYDDETRNNAVMTIARAVEDTPGKVVKVLPVDIETFVSDIVGLLEDEQSQVRTNAAIALTWISRDYTDIVEKHTEKIKSAMLYTGPLKGPMAIVLGNIGADYPDRVDDLAQAIRPAVSDEDPEIRRTAADALGQLESQTAIDYLENLADDNHPEVREAAQKSLHHFFGTPQVSPNQQHGDSKGSGTGAELSQEEFEFVGEPPETDFDDIVGMDELKSRLRQTVLDPFTGENDAFERFEVGSESGILLHGPPGTGKTHIAKCLAGELGANYAAIDVGSIESKWLGESVENIARLFDEARVAQPTLVFIDEFDALAAGRGGDGQMHQDKKKIVTQLLQELSEIQPDDDLLVIGATNRPEDIDEAILRSGRFDSKIEIPMPDSEARWQLFQHQLTGPAESVPRVDFVHATAGFSASDIVEVARRTSRAAAVRQQETDTETTIRRADVFNAIDQLSGEISGVGEYIRDPPDIDFDDVVGMESLKQDLREKVIEPIEHPSDYEEFGLSVGNGFLLFGPPGTGKTHISRALAGELGINYIEANAADLVSKWIGEGAQNVQELFVEATENQPTLVFIDEIDALATDRESQQTKSERQMVNQFLGELSTINEADQEVVVIGATNMLEDVESALLRSGRLGEHIEVPPPDVETRASLFESHLDAPNRDIDSRWVAEKTRNFVASDMVQLAEKSARIAMVRYREEGTPKAVTQKDVEAALTQFNGDTR